jgi:hypothetical protein
VDARGEARYVRRSVPSALAVYLNARFGRGLVINSVARLVFTSGTDTYVWTANFAGHMAVCPSIPPRTAESHLTPTQCSRQGGPTEPIAWYERAKSAHTGSAAAQPAVLSFALEAAALALREDVLLAWMVFCERARARMAKAAAQTLEANSALMNMLSF